LPGGRLVPRTAVGAVIEEVDEVVGRALALARGEPILAVDGSFLPLEVESICVHSDTPGAVRLTRRIREAFAQEPALKIGPV
jgi:5-oxoprolinase (ATP-hydrolysing) subunit A